MLPGATSARDMNELLFEPPTTPQQSCEIQPCFEIGSVTYTQPLGSILVYLLALFWIAGGSYFWRIRDGQRSRELICTGTRSQK